MLYALIAAVNNGSLMPAGRRKRRGTSADLTGATSAGATSTDVQSASAVVDRHNTKPTPAAGAANNIGKPTNYNNNNNNNDNDNHVSRLSCGEPSVKKAKTSREPASDRRASTLLDVKTGSRTTTSASTVRGRTSTGSTESELPGKLNAFLKAMSANR